MAAKAPRAKDIEAEFKKYDKDGNGSVSLEEAHEILRDKLGLTSEGTFEMLRAFDKNNDGKLSYEEFCKFFEDVKKKEKEIEAEFKKYDKDGNGFVSVKEAHDVLHVKLGLTLEDTQKILDMYDKNKDGKLSYTEFCKFYTALNQKNVRDNFRLFDKDKSGTINAQEAYEVLREYGLTKRDVESLIKTFDVNNDGELEYDEFLNMWTAGDEK